MNYLIWSSEHRGWWGSNHFGYVQKVEEAGRYSHEEALLICRKALPGQWRPGTPGFPEIPVAEADAILLALSAWEAWHRRYPPAREETDDAL